MHTLHHPLCLPEACTAGPTARFIDRLVTRPIAELIAGMRRRRLHRATVETLHSLDDRTLRDLGWHRSEIGGVAAEIGGETEITYVRTRLAHHLRA